MFFTKAGRTIAWLCVAGSVLHYGYLQVFAIQQGGILPGHPKWDSLSAASLKDIQLFAFGVAIGILAEISRSLASLAQTANSARTTDTVGTKE
jgi:nitrate reductase gamma subunit